MSSTLARPPRFARLTTPGSGRDRRFDLGGPRLHAEAMLRIVVALTWLFWSSRFYVAIYQVPFASALTVFYSIGALVACAVALGARSERTLARLDAVLMVGAVAGLVLWSVALIHNNSNYGTDEAAFTQGAAQLLLQGHNPYGPDLTSFLQTYGVAPSGWTATLSGGYVNHLGYPSLSFLFMVPLLALGIVTQVQIWVNLALFCVGAVILWRLLPPKARNVVPALLALDAYGSAISAGLIFGTALPFAVLAVVGWDRFGVAGGSLRVRRLAPVFLGLACAVRQDLWIMAPFLVIAVGMEARASGAGAWRRSGAYLGLVVLGFGVPNLPFMVWDPVAWVKGVFSPLLQGLTPLGQGAIGLSLYLGVGGGRLIFYTALLLIATATLLLAVLIRYDRLKPIIPLIPAAVLTLSTRSLAQYLLFGVMVAVAAMVTTGPAPTVAPWPEHVTRWLRRGLVGGAVAAGAALAVALTFTPALTVDVVGYHTTGQQGSVDSITVSVHNGGRSARTPEFLVGGGPYVGVPWLTDRVARTPILGGQTATYRLLAPNVSVMPSAESNLKVYALTNAPAAISSSSLQQLGGVVAKLSPNAVNRFVAPGEQIELQVQLSDRYGKPITRAGQPVSLGQAQYTPQGVLAAEAVINGSPVGASPVRVTTDNNGIARFTVSARAPIPHQVYFQAWLGDTAPHGYSHQLSVWFSTPDGPP